LGKKENEFYIRKKCNHAKKQSNLLKNKANYFQRNHIIIAKQVIMGGLKGEKERKRQKIDTILHLLQ
jgi:hypothetical protein